MANTQLNHWTKPAVGGLDPIDRVGPNKLSRAVADLFHGRPAGGSLFRSVFGNNSTTTVYNVCGLPCILGLTNPNNQVSLTTKEHSARCNGASPVG